MPYAGYLGVEGRIEDGAVTAILPFRDDLIGNTRLPALHGGAQGAFLEIAALAALALELEDEARQPLTVGVTVEYLRPGRAKLPPSPARRSSAWAGGWPTSMSRPGRTTRPRPSPFCRAAFYWWFRGPSTA